MGINSQSSVPTFVTGQVLTAEQQRQSAGTGVPVFNDTTQRDAAFGGTGEKTLAEGQLCYLESTDQVLVYNGTSWVGVAPTSTVGVIAYTQATATTAYTSGTALTVLSQAATIVPNRRYRVGGRMSFQSASGNTSNKSLWIDTTSSDKIVWQITGAQGGNLPATASGDVIFTASELGVTSGTGTSVTFNLRWRDSGNSGNLNTDPDGVVGTNSSPQQLFIEDVGSI